MKLRPYQERALSAAREHYRAGKRSVLLVSPTGSGKTVIGASAAQSHRTRAGQVVWIAHRIELVKQALDKLWKAGIQEIGAITAEGGFNPTAPVVVCSIQTLLARGARPKASLLIPDEAHHYLSQEWNRVASHYAGVPVLGLTATPQRADGTGLLGMFDALVSVASNRELVDEGFLVPIDVLGPPKRLSGADLIDPVGACEKHAQGRRAVIFASSVAHARALLARMPGAGYIDGTTPADERAETLERFERGDITRLVNVFVLTEGWDCPAAEVCVIARGCSSSATFLQMVGRVRRPSPETGKARALLVDCKGAVHEHGLPDDDRVYSLAGKPITLHEKLPPIRQCPQCGAVFRFAGTCERCSYVFPEMPAPKHKSAELRTINQVAPEGVKRDFLRSQLETARKFNRKAGWASYRFKWRFGHWPSHQLIQEASR